MHLFLDERRAELSVREFSEFRLGPTSRSTAGAGPWRANIGQSWHRDLQKQALEEFGCAEFEVPINGLWRHRDWRISLQGRVDQVIYPKGRITIREIKTVDIDLPAEEEILRENYESHFLQLASYLSLAQIDSRWSSERIRGELIFVDISSGLLQPVSLAAEQQVLFHRQLERLTVFLRHRLHARRRVRNLRFRSPFREYREGQEEAREELRRFANQTPIVLFEAPTGFGKTGLILDFALERLRHGHFDRIVYLTGKSTGQIQIGREVEEMVTPGGSLHYFQMRNRAEHAIDSPLHSCRESWNCRRDIEERWESSGISPLFLFDDGSLSLERIKELGRKNGICPYEISRSALPYAELWLADYNYLFSPRSRDLFFEQPGFHPQKTMLIIDEAHNLPSRVAQAYSQELTCHEAEALLDDLQFAGFNPTGVESATAFVYALLDLRAGELIDLDGRYEYCQLLERIVEALRGSRLNYELLSSETANYIHTLYQMLVLIRDLEMEQLLWAPRDGALQCTCLDASSEIALTLRGFGQVILMSATLSPIEQLRTSTGLSQERSSYLKASAPWRHRTYDVAVDCRVDTRFRSRSNYHYLTAETVDTLCRSTETPVVVFFSSYRYAADIADQIESFFPETGFALQPRNLSLKDQSAFLERALEKVGAILLILGSNFSEGVDTLGGRVSRAMVVGPALPEVNLIQQTKLEKRMHLGRATAFRDVYIVPAMMKINQALGRLVRAPGQRASVLLHCRRFSDPAYHRFLDEELGIGTTIGNTQDLEQWISRLST